MLDAPVPPLQEHREEAWHAGPATAWGRDEGEAWVEAGGWLAVALWAPVAPDLERTAHRLYGRLLARTSRLAAHPCRIWNHVPGINEGPGDAERYRLFNAGRARALAETWGAEAARRSPAASAVGAEGHDLVVWALAGPHRGTAAENPRQVPAWEYPREYGPRPPCFARALALPAEAGGLALVSGTAAVVGHRTLHPGDVAAQLGVALDNLDAVRAALPGRYAPAALKGYLRRPGDAPLVRAALAGRRPGVPSLLLRADICRADLEVEIEETCRPV